jgi:predicted phage replisome organizer
MADNVQWIKLKVGMFDGNSFKKIKRAKIGGVSYRDKLTAVWVELLDLAGKCNKDGYLIDTNEIPYHTYEDIAVMLDREEKEIELCMNFFINEKMVEIVDDIYCLTNFMEYQNKDGLEKIREGNRERQARFREKKKQLLIENKR